MRSKAATIITSSVFAIFHVIVVVVPVISSGANGEGQAFAVVIFDVPLVWLLSAMPGGNTVLYNNRRAYTFVFCIFGTLMYAAVGGLIGWIIDVIRVKRRGA